eukprot:CAMPEP_0172449410 /NCGR_PEP_ID=MMETSP1065-20121228/8127_1 /TAXON_ID=265537 /ORGANISM="Amphiprora paludosa, Strain CCMP125" /LENGTH=357 /DNA_ID=CAMNT_0013201081 /DNA_START=213 /DNA_END=1286 /DNA_ORIENTATION=+
MLSLQSLQPPFEKSTPHVTTTPTETQDWKTFCPQFERDLLITLFQSSFDHDTAKVTIVSEFFRSTPYVALSIHENIQSNHHLAHFVFLVGDNPQSQLEELQSLVNNVLRDLSLTSLKYDIYYAPGGVTYRHLFAASMPYSIGPFLIHNADISLGNVQIILDSCPNNDNLDNTLVVGSRNDIFRAASLVNKQKQRGSRLVKNKVNCEEYKQVGSFDVFYTNHNQIACHQLNNLRFPPYYWGAENVVASQVKSHVANLCPYWNEFWHFHAFDNNTDATKIASEQNSNRGSRIRLNHPVNSWHNPDPSNQLLKKACNVTMLKEYHENLNMKALEDQAMALVRRLQSSIDNNTISQDQSVE